MRILHVTRDFSPRTIGGISTAVGGMVKALQRSGVQCAVLSFDGWRPVAKARPGLKAAALENQGGVEVLRVRSISHLSRARSFAEQWLHIGEPTVLHVHHDTLWDFAREIRTERPLPAVLSVHVLHREQMRLRGYDGFTQSLQDQEKALVECDAVIAPSLAATRILLHDYPEIRPRLRTIGFGVDDSKEAHNNAFHRQEGSVRTALYVGRFSDIKGTFELYETIPEVLGAVPDAKFVIAGGIPENQRMWRRWLRRWESKADSQLQARVTFAGWLSAHALEDCYRQAALLVCPSRFETFGMTALEGMLHGLAVAAPDGGALAELVTHGATGLLSPPGDVNRLVDNIITLLNDRDCTFRLGLNGAREVRAKRLWDHIVPVLLNLYEDLIATGC
ncbi:glycosyltransferase family 4 protein [Acidobacteriota bacterium]